MDFATLRMYLTPLAEGTVWTLALFFCSAFLAVALGLVVCLCRLSRHAALSRAARVYIDIIRGTPRCCSCSTSTTACPRWAW